MRWHTLGLSESQTSHLLGFKIEPVPVLCPGEDDTVAPCGHEHRDHAVDCAAPVAEPAIMVYINL